MRWHEHWIGPCMSIVIYGASTLNMQRSSMCSVAASFHDCMLWSATCCICFFVRGIDATPTSLMQIIVGFMLRTTPKIVLYRSNMLALRRRLLCLAAFQSILMNTTLADTAVLCSSSASRSCPVAAVIWGEVQQSLLGGEGRLGSSQKTTYI